jgi:hypothetical protein
MPHYYFDYWNGHIATPGKEGVESRKHGSVRGAISNERAYRDRQPQAGAIQRCHRIVSRILATIDKQARLHN